MKLVGSVFESLSFGGCRGFGLHNVYSSPLTFWWSSIMRRPVDKKRSARSFRKQVRKTKSANIARPGRGGYRL